MEKKGICQNCQYARAYGSMDFDILGKGDWCSNSASPKFRSRVTKNDGCAVFSERGKRAPIMLRLKVSGLMLINKIIFWLFKK